MMIDLDVKKTIAVVGLMVVLLGAFAFRVNYIDDKNETKIFNPIDRMQTAALNNFKVGK